MTKPELIPKHGGYRRLKSFQIGQLVYDLTVRFASLSGFAADHPELTAEVA